MDPGTDRSRPGHRSARRYAALHYGAARNQSDSTSTTVTFDRCPSCGQLMPVGHCKNFGTRETESRYARCSAVVRHRLILRRSAHQSYFLLSSLRIETGAESGGHSSHQARAAVVCGGWPSHRVRPSYGCVGPMLNYHNARSGFWDQPSLPATSPE